MEQILLAYGPPKETVTTKMMLYKNTKAMVCSLDRDTDSFGILVRVLQGDTLAPYLFIWLNNILQILIDLCCVGNLPPLLKVNCSAHGVDE